MKLRASPKTIGIGTITLAIGGFLGLMAFGLLNIEPVTGQSGFTRVQKPAPEFTLSNFDGGDIALSDYLGQPIVINFWASWCPPCREEAPLLERVWRDYRDDGVMFLGVDIQDGEESGMRFLEQYDITYPNGLDKDGRVTIDYGVIGLPVTFFVNREGIIERRWVGALREKRLVAWIDELIAGVAPSSEAEGENLEGYLKFE